MIRICQGAIKYSIYILVFFLPLAFMPWTSEVIDFNKQALLLLFVFAAFFVWMLKSLLSAKITFGSGKYNLALLLLLLALLLSVLFSTDRQGSFWGWPKLTGESFLTAASLILFYFLLTDIFTKENIGNLLVVFSASVLLCQIIALFQMLGVFIFPFDFTKSAVFNTFGGVGALGVFSAVLSPLAMAMLQNAKKWAKLLFGLQLVFSFVILVLLNYPGIWIILALGSALFLALCIFRKDVLPDARWTALPMFFLIVSLFFIFLNPQINWLPHPVNEIFLSQKTTFDIAMKSIRERPFLGSGPATFNYDFSKFRDPQFSSTPFWNVSFDSGASKMLDILATTGILGFMSWFAVVLAFVFLGAKFVFSHSENIASQFWLAVMGIFSSLLLLSAAFFLYPSNLTLDFAYFFLAACLTVLAQKDKINFRLEPSSPFLLVTIFIFTVLFIFGSGILILEGQRYVAEINYSNALADLQDNRQEQGIKNLEAAAAFNPSSDLYFRQLSLLYLSELQTELLAIKTTPDQGQQQKFQTLLSNAVNASKIATDIGPNSVKNWSVRAYVYQNLAGLLGDAYTWAQKSYDQALLLDPNDPYLMSQKASALLAEANALTSADVLNKKNLLAESYDLLQKALQFNPQYSDAMFCLGLVYDARGQKSKAIEQFKKLQQLNPQNADVAKILENLNAGRSALQNAKAPEPEKPLVK